MNANQIRKTIEAIKAHKTAVARIIDKAAMRDFTRQELAQCEHHQLAIAKLQTELYRSN